MTKLYYEAPSDAAFEEMKNASIEVWGRYKDSPGDYYEEKVSRIRDIKNVSDNFMYMLSMFDSINQQSVVRKLSEETKRAVRERMLDGGASEYEINRMGL